MYTLSDFDFSLPDTLIAQIPLPERHQSRLLEVTEKKLLDRTVTELGDTLSAGDLLVFNNTRVMRARLFGTKQTGGRVEILIERITGDKTALARIRASRPPRDASCIRVNGYELHIQSRQGEYYSLLFPDTVLRILEHCGHLPLPPYITRQAEKMDDTRYQTVYADVSGAIASPTAGLHFSPPLLDGLRQKGVQFAYLTLHVGSGTFQPVRTENLSAHRMHEEWYCLPESTVTAIGHAKENRRNIVAVGTTTLRALESSAQSGVLHAGEGNTRLFITPGYSFRTANRLLTNFHLPKSSLLMLVSAFAGYERIREAYAHAITQRYRFFSYGDAMLLNCANPPLLSE
ncbi:MAG: tRNA preQ1(34) S-adenosylmethionine ribosyltransferase-isomerase QueA [Burkholderiaceae bacterium]|jgi:S-adenosylmethionine:tRNA ribosyltransferase-isomerase|nr:tRNA preQ1(34) S-adenosylmethionine ribosyltransferase-isomerase QueA [Burkholderiaceae bacterium]